MLRSELLTKPVDPLSVADRDLSRVARAVETSAHHHHLVRGVGLDGRADAVGSVGTRVVHRRRPRVRVLRGRRGDPPRFRDGAVVAVVHARAVGARLVGRALRVRRAAGRVLRADAVRARVSARALRVGRAARGVLDADCVRARVPARALRVRRAARGAAVAGAAGAVLAASAGDVGAGVSPLHARPVGAVVRRVRAGAARRRVADGRGPLDHAGVSAGAGDARAVVDRAGAVAARIARLPGGAGRERRAGGAGGRRAGTGLADGRRGTDGTRESCAIGLRSAGRRAATGAVARLGRVGVAAGRGRVVAATADERGERGEREADNESEARNDVLGHGDLQSEKWVAGLTSRSEALMEGVVHASESNETNMV